MKKIFFFILSAFMFSINSSAQKIDTDSLLVKTSYELNTNKNYEKAIQMAHLGIEKAPDYLDFHLILGRSYMLTKQADSARFYLNHVIDKNPKYKDAFLYLTKLEIEEKNSPNANVTADKALQFYPEDKDFYILKLQAISLENDEEKTISFLTNLTKKYPTDSDLQQQLIELKYKSVSDRLGINYNITTFDRDGIGPWHLLGVQYVRERKKLSLIGRLNYADRHSLGSSINSGVQYELETYFKNNKKSYSNANLSFSNATVFPKLRLSYSYYHNLNKGWEGDIGMRYTKTTDKNLYAGVIGLSKYIGSYWLNFKSYWQSDEDKIHPAFTATARYYFDTKYDYFTILAGYGTSPDERALSDQLQQRIALNSYRIGVGYYKILFNHFCTGIQTGLNHQEYIPNNFQNEIDLSLSIQYKF